MRFGFSAVLFDVDGTLIDSNAAHAETWTQALNEAGYAVEVERVRSLIGTGGDKLLPTLTKLEEGSKQGQAIAHRKKALFATRLPDLRPTHGARALVQYLRDSNVALVVATSSDERDMRALLDRADVADLIPDRASKDDAPRSKPDPDIVKAALSEAGARPRDAVLVGDTPYDIEAAGRTGVTAIALRCGGYWEDEALSGAIAIFDDPAALLAHWRG